MRCGVEDLNGDFSGRWRVVCGAGHDLLGIGVKEGERRADGMD
jgi:hypothetical protein